MDWVTMSNDDGDGDDDDNDDSQKKHFEFKVERLQVLKINAGKKKKKKKTKEKRKKKKKTTLTSRFPSVLFTESFCPGPYFSVIQNMLEIRNWKQICFTSKGQSKPGNVFSRLLPSPLQFNTDATCQEMYGLTFGFCLCSTPCLMDVLCMDITPNTNGYILRNTHEMRSYKIYECHKHVLTWSILRILDPRIGWTW